MNDKIRVALILAGNEAAREQLYKDYAGRLYAAACVFLGVHDVEAEDVVQETFAAVLKDLSQFEFRASLYTWMNHICVNLCYRRLRQRRRVLVGLDADFEKLAGSAALRRARDEAQQDEVELKKALVWEQLEKLKESCREILKLRHSDGMAYALLAEKLKVPVGTVMSRLARCRNELKVRVLKVMQREDDV